MYRIYNIAIVMALRAIKPSTCRSIIGEKTQCKVFDCKVDHEKPRAFFSETNPSSTWSCGTLGYTTDPFVVGHDKPYRNCNEAALYNGPIFLLTKLPAS